MSKTKPETRLKYYYKNKKKISLEQKSYWQRVGKARWEEKYHNNPEYREIIRERGRKYLFGLKEGEYQVLLDSQNGVCAVCKGNCLTGRKLSVDHNHATGKVRGLLCAKCNSALGMVNDRIDLLEELVSYLKNHQ